MGAAGKIRIATHIEIAWLDGSTAAVCPNCGFAGEVSQRLEIDYRPPGAAHRFILQSCPRCTACFVDNPETMDYSTEELIEIGWHVYQIQLGAGVWPIAAPLTRIDKPAGARVLEIGGAYGFGLDFCLRARGWEGEGFDPSPLAEFGARELGLSIRQDYFEAKDLARGPYDVVIATELIEHLTRPPEFFELMRRAVADDGLLVLTTPDAAWITPELAAPLLMPLLSPGAHQVLQTEPSLRQALNAAGFTHVVIIRESMSLVAYASARPFTLNEDAAAGRAMYRNYLVERAGLTTATSDLRLGFAGRGLFEAANDGDFAAAETAWEMLAEAAQARFGLDLETAGPLPAGAAEADLAALGRLMPLGLGMILFARVMQLLGQGTKRRELLPKLRLAAAAGTALQDALGRRSLTDGLTASILNVLEGEVALCLAEAGEAAAVQALTECLKKNAAHVSLPWRGLTGLINAGAYGPALSLQESLRLDWSAQSLAALEPATRQDALTTLLMLDLALKRDLKNLPERIEALTNARLDDDRLRDLTFAAFVGLVNEAEFGTASSLLYLVRPALRALRQPYAQAERNALFTAGILALQDRNDLLYAALTFGRLRDDLLKQSPMGEQPNELFWPALRGEILALVRLDRNEEALELLNEFVSRFEGVPDDLVALLPTNPDAAQRDI